MEIEDYKFDILLIDDQLEEAYVIQENLLKNKFCPVIAKPQEITEAFILQPSIIFCDINLFGLNNDDMNFKTINGILKKIYKNNTPYIFILWTTHPDKETTFREYLANDSNVIQPLEIICMDKNDSDNIGEKLKQLLRQIISNNPDFAIFSIIKSIIKESGADVINLLNNLYNLKDFQFRGLLRSIAAQNIGEENLNNNEDYALSTPISYFIKDCIDKNIYTNFLHTEFTSLFKNIKTYGKKDLNIAIKSKINTIMHINENTCNNIAIPGDYYKIQMRTLQDFMKDKTLTKTELIKKLVKDKNKKNSVLLGLIEISADCDFANHKTMGICKFVLGYLCPSNIFNKSGNLGECFQVVDIEYNTKPYKLIIDARFIISVNSKNVIHFQKLFSIREGLFKKIRHDIYVHNNRLGTISF